MNISGGFKPGQSGNPAGKPKGATNHLNRSIKDMVERALVKAGGVNYLVEQAHKNPVAFMGLVGRIVPLQVTGQGENGALLIDFRWADAPVVANATRAVANETNTATAEITDVTWSDISEC